MTPSPAQEGVGSFEGEAVVGGIWEVMAASPFSPTSEAGLPKELEKQQAPGREVFAGGMVSNEQHRAQVPSRDTSPSHSCLPSHLCHAALIFLSENLFRSAKL